MNDRDTLLELAQRYADGVATAWRRRMSRLDCKPCWWTMPRHGACFGHIWNSTRRWNESPRDAGSGRQRLSQPSVVSRRARAVVNGQWQALWNVNAVIVAFRSAKGRPFAERKATE